MLCEDSDQPKFVQSYQSLLLPEILGDPKAFVMREFLIIP